MSRNFLANFVCFLESVGERNSQVVEEGRRTQQAVLVGLAAEVWQMFAD